METSGINKSLGPQHKKIVIQFTHPVSRVKSHTSSSNMPRPPQECLGSPLSCIVSHSLPEYSLSSFSERSLVDDWLLASIPSWNTPDQIPHP